MDINKSLKNNLGILLKSKNNNTISKNKKFVQSFFNIKTNLSYQASTFNSFDQNLFKSQEDKSLLNRKKIAPIDERNDRITKMEEKIPKKGKDENEENKNSLILKLEQNKKLIQIEKSKLNDNEEDSHSDDKPKHSKWKLYKVIAGHTGWVRCIDVDQFNKFFVTGSNDRVIKFWDLASGKLKVSYTGHINTIRKVVLSKRYPYLFSCGEDKKVKCWDLETNKAIRQYHGHLSGVYCLSLHPNLDILTTGGRDCVARVWDMRSRQQIACLEGHTNTVYSVLMQENEPQIITGSSDCTIKLWDIRNGQLLNTLTHHKKCIRDLLIPDKEYSFISAGADDIKTWSCPEGKYIRSIKGSEGIINSIALNQDGVFVSGGEDGKLFFWDYDTGEIFQKIKIPIQPGSMESETQIFDCKFDMTETRLITAGCDKTIKMFKQIDEEEEYDDEEDKNKNKFKHGINLNENEEDEEYESEDNNI